MPPAVSPGAAPVASRPFKAPSALVRHARWISGTPTSLAALPLVERAEVPFLSLAGSVLIVEPAKKWVFKTAHTDRMACDKVFADLRARGLTRVALLSEQWPVEVERRLFPALARLLGGFGMRVSLSEPGGGFLRANRPGEGRWYSRDVQAIGRTQGITTLAPYFVDADATSNPGGCPRGGLTVVRFPNSHLIYALTWFGLALLTGGAAVYVVADARRTHRKEDE